MSKIKKINLLKSIRTKIVGMAIGCILAALIVTYVSIVPGARNSITDSSENNMLDLAKSYIKILNNSISAINETTISLESEPDIYNCVMKQGGEAYLVEAELNEYIRSNSSYSKAEIYDLSGNFIASSSRENELQDTPYYVNAVLSTGIAAQSDIITENVDEPSVVCAVPLTNSGSIYGVMCVTVPAKIITADLSEIKLQGIDSSFAYLISPQGYFIYHPDDEIVGKITGNDIIRGFLEQGNVASAIGRFNYDGSDKIIGLATSATNNWMFVIQADKSELLASISNLTVISVIVLFITLLVLALIVYLMSVTITRPIRKLTVSINNISNLDFRENEDIYKLGKRSDETGEMSRALIEMQTNIRNIIENINTVSQNIGNSSSSLFEISASLNDCASDNSSVSEELAAGMEQTSHTVSDINDRIDYIRNMTNKVTDKTMDTIELSKSIIKRADLAKENTVNAADNTKKLYSEVSTSAKDAMEKSKAVNKITELTQTIMDIADQTSLLALNASIEAARSGEYGKGFAVVANEIGHLATESSDTVYNIKEIVSEVIDAVNHMDSCLSRILTFLDTSVMKDYQDFVNVSGEYNSDAATFSDTIKEICDNIEELGKATNIIAESVSGINSTITESTEGINGIADRASDVVSLSSETYNKVQDNNNMADMLRDIVNKFMLE